MIGAFITIYRDGDELTVFVQGEYLPGQGGRHTLSNGDPGYPEEPDDIEVTDVRDQFENEVELNEAERQEAKEALWGTQSIRSRERFIKDR